MKKVLVVTILAVSLIYISGCKSINVGASGQIGPAQGSGSVSIPLPEKTK